MKLKKLAEVSTEILKNNSFGDKQKVSDANITSVGVNNSEKEENKTELKKKKKVTKRKAPDSEVQEDEATQSKKPLV